MSYRTLLSGVFNIGWKLLEACARFTWCLNWLQVVGLLNCTASHLLIGYVSLEADLIVPDFSLK